jgi:hypothetical protein
MKTKLFIPLMLFFFAAFAFSQEINKDEQTEQYRKNISLLNLVNGLYLTNNQIETMVPVLKDLKELQKDYQGKYNSLLPDLKKEYAALYNEVLANKGITKETEKSAGGIHKQELDLKDEYMDKLSGLEEKINGILTENQLCIIDDFKPCLIPPKNLKDPARVGQAKGDASGVVNHFDNIRKIPERRFETAKKKFIEGYIDKYEKKIEVLSPEKKNEEIQRVDNILNEVRSLKPVDYEMKKEGLAQQLLLDKEKKNAKKKYELGKAGKFLLNTELLPILEQRLVALK